MEKLEQRYCTCGAYWRGRPITVAVEIIDSYWRKNHSGEGHASCDSATAARARTIAERQRMAEGR